MRQGLTVGTGDANGLPARNEGYVRFSAMLGIPSTPADPQEGSSCAATTSMDAISPGAVSEGKRSVWQLDRVRVFDGGADGDGDTVGDNTLFARAGLFIP